ncbi:MAG: helix-turn-helix transcriptional regulator [Desulfomicrobium sp.]|nr:helix-turn-helix transcriptional regulator [Desulfomicrobium sp.]
MLELTKKPHTEGMVDICLRVPVADVGRISQAIREVLSKAGEHVRESDTGGEAFFTVDEVFSDMSAGALLVGARCKEGMTQQQLATETGIARRHISEMENNKRAIGKNIAQRLARALRVDYRVFL